MNLLVYAGYFAVGLIEWALALVRTMAIIKGRTVVAVTTVFVENLVGLLVLSSFIKNGDIVLAVAYSAGAAVGCALPLMSSSRRKDGAI